MPTSPTRLGDASCGSQTDFKCIGGRLDVYGVLKDGAGTSSRLVKSGDKTLNITGMHANTYTGGTIVNAGPIKMQKPAGINAIPGDVTVNGTGGLIDECRRRRADCRHRHRHPQ